MAADLQSAQHFMQRELITLSPSDKILSSVSALLSKNISGAPVVDSQSNYLGVFSEKCCLNALTDITREAQEHGDSQLRVSDFMTSGLITLKTSGDVFESIDYLLQKQISGAPVLDDNGRFLGIFSEKTAMRVLIDAAYNQLPGVNVGAYMNTDRARIINEQDDLLTIAQKFQQTPYRRLPVLRSEIQVGQVSRRDVLRAQLQQAQTAAASGAETPLQEIGSFVDCEARTIGPSTDLLQVAQIFLNSPYRRLPVVDDTKLVGLVSRRDLLNAAAVLLKPEAKRPRAATLYLSPVSDSIPSALD